MGWLDELEYDVRFTCECGKVTHQRMKASEDFCGSTIACECGLNADYSGFEPMQFSLGTKVAFDQNGRKAYKFSDGKGGVSYMSQSKYNYMETGKVSNAYTKDYEDSLVKANRTDLLTPEINKRRGLVSKDMGEA
jgi:hypothetical protein